MVVAPLTKVTLKATKADLGAVLAGIVRFGTFHPIREDGMEQDIGILLLASKAQEVYGRAGDILLRGGFGAKPLAKEVERFEARDLNDLVDSLDGYVRTVEDNAEIFATEHDREGVVSVLLAVQEAALMAFEDLQRILVLPQADGSVALKGYVPTRSLATFRAALGGALVSEDPAKPSKPDGQGKGEPYVPSLLVNRRVVSFFESLTLMRGLPRYGEVDPTPIIALVFPLFFGLMFGDVGHGLALAVFGAYLIYGTQYGSWGKQVLVLSLSTTLVGLVRGVAFGLTFTSPLASLFPLPPVFSASFTLSYVPLLLEVAVVVGTFHLASGYVIAFVNDERVGDHRRAFLNRLPTAVLYTFVVPLGFAVAGTGLALGTLFTSDSPTPVFDQLLGLQVPLSLTARASLPFVLCSSLVMVLGYPAVEGVSLRSWRKVALGLGAGALDALVKLFEFFTNTLSYIRLGVLLITTTLLETLTADVLAAGLAGVAIGAFLNVCVIGLEGLVVYIQDMRLQLYEWFSSFYNGGGVPFVPLVSGGVRFTIDWAARPGLRAAP